MRKRHWWQGYNWDAPLWWLGGWLNKRARKIKKAISRLIAIVIGIMIASHMPHTITQLRAGFTNTQELKRKAKEKIEFDAREAERKYQQHLLDQERSKEARKQKDLQAEKERIKAVEEEISAEFDPYDRIIITWWGNIEDGADAPEGCSKTGQILKIEGEYIYGTWGDRPLKWHQAYWHKCSAKEMREVKKKEEQAKAKKKKKYNVNMTEYEKRYFAERGIIYGLVE